MSVRIYFAASAAILLSGCASFNSGKVDYRRAAPLTADQALSKRDVHLEECWKDTDGKAEERLTDANSRCAFMLPTTLSDKNFALPQDTINVNDVYSIRLDYGLIQTLGETFGNVRLGSLQSRRPLQQQGEIAVLVNAFEFAPQGSDGSPAPRFYNLGQASRSNGESGTISPDYSSARVVYFSPDVLRGQSLNLSNIPITAPQKYHGRPIGVQIIVIELDRLGDSTKSLLKGLADLGRTTIGPSGATDTLLTLGKSLLDGSNDDVIFEYRFVMDNASGLGKQIVSPFTAGRYVFRRTENRQVDMIWNQLRLDQNTGQLLRVDKGKEGETRFTPYSPETYFTISVINHGPNGIEGRYEAETWQQASEKFDSFLNAATSINIAQTALQETLDQLITTRRSLNSLRALDEKTRQVTTAWQALARLPRGLESGNDLKALSDYENSTPELKLQCKQNWESRRRQALLARQDAEAITSQLLKSWPGSSDIEASEEQVAIERFRTGLNAALGPEDPGNRAFPTTEFFKANFVTAEAGFNELVKNLDARVAGIREPVSCAVLAR
ncbi:MAG: hypothetical protein O9253_00220 [Aquidulcibacter sp.]|jgi:hypothetical protein|nr:hypothetical protein [Aquidulcibacter sp.]